jgi:sugar lactone lactonase YvrE
LEVRTEGVAKLVEPRRDARLRIDLPVEKPSRPMFGGPNLDTLYVTTLGLYLAEGSTQPDAGGLLAITGLGVRGLPQSRFPDHPNQR